MLQSRLIKYINKYLEPIAYLIKSTKTPQKPAMLMCVKKGKREYEKRAKNKNKEI